MIGGLRRMMVINNEEMDEDESKEMCRGFLE
jgi:hypothetical protein